ncbi:uncharacterized protein LOC133463332 isoform X3 [Cololabis saira]|uniref:uncharacterized protein LOC133463332 isoform X3 n=1 Tax=Cololabis saira TaxID=129043 RepID=UPI002AD3F4EC|nr:uncharacterized protein LOC133463332 isoform X3 [Cololabis saira]
MSGLETRHRTYARATANLETTEDAPQEELLTLEQQVSDKGLVSILVLLDLSAAFDTIDHGILLHRPKFSWSPRLDLSPYPLLSPGPIATHLPPRAVCLVDTDCWAGVNRNKPIKPCPPHMLLA